MVVRQGAEPEHGEDHHLRGPGPGRYHPDTVGKTIASANVKGQGNDLVLDTSSFYKPTQAGSYPIVLATYEVVCSKYPDADTGKAVKAFLQSAIGAGQNGSGRQRLHPDPRGIHAEADDGSERDRVI